MIKRDNYLSYKVVGKECHILIQDKYFSIYSVLTHTLDILRENSLANEEELKLLNSELLQTLTLLKSSRVKFPAQIDITYKDKWIIGQEFKK